MEGTRLGAKELEGNHQKQGGAVSPVEPLDRTDPANTLILDFSPPELKRINFCHLVPFCLW